MTNETKSEVLTALKDAALTLSGIFKTQGLDPNGNQAFQRIMSAIKKLESES